jgi:hypothetical protein
VRQSLYLRGADCQIWIKEVRQSDPIRFRSKPKKPSVGVEGIGAATFYELERILLTAINQPLSDPSINAEDQIERVGAEASHLYDLGHATRS